MKKTTKRAIRKIASTILMAVLFISSMASITYYHENVHKEIFRSYGIDSTIEYNFLWMGGRTITNETCSTEQCTISHNQNEIIGYSLSALVVALWCMLFTWRILKGDMIR